MSSSTSSSEAPIRASDEPARVSVRSPIRPDQGWSGAVQFLPVLGLFVVLLGLHQVIVAPTLGPARYSENISHASLIAAQDALSDSPADTAVVGSSITGRFRSDFFAEWGLPVMGLGLDGQGPTLGIDLLTAADRIPPMVAVEMNRALYTSSGNAEVITGAVNGLNFDLAAVIPALRADGRPTSLVYSDLKVRRDGRGDPDAGRGVRPETWRASSVDTFTTDELTEEQRASVRLMHQSLDTVVDHGGCVVLFLAPDNANAGPDEQAFTRHLSARYDAWVIDLRSLTPQVDLAYTDSIHLDVVSARLSSHVLAGALLDIQRTEPDCHG